MRLLESQTQILSSIELPPHPSSNTSRKILQCCVSFVCLNFTDCGPAERKLVVIPYHNSLMVSGFTTLWPIQLQTPFFHVSMKNYKLLHNSMDID